MQNIRAAATVILAKVTPNGSKLQIYLMKRPQTMRSFQSYTVFPGGLLEQQDHLTEWEEYIRQPLKTYPLLPERLDYPTRASTMSSVGTIPELPYVVAAIREVFEETGILLCQSEGVPPESSLQLYRKALLKKEMTFLDMIKHLDIHLNVEKLVYIGRRVTPPPTTITFDANFYLARVPVDTISIPSEKEVESEKWIDPSGALTLVEQKEIICAPATIECFQVLRTLNRPIETLWP